MFVAIAEVYLKDGAEGDFVGSFADANAELSECEGFVGRRLLKSGDGSFRILVEHDSRETFERMHQGDIHAKWHKVMISHMARAPSPRFYTVVAQ